MLDTGIKMLLEPGLTDLKRPKFNSNADFDFSVFEESFDFFVARSIWTHASKDQIRLMLDGFVHHSKDGGAFITSYVRPSLFKREYKGAKWVGRSHESDTPGIVRHSLGWIQKECKERGLFAKEIKDKEYNFGNQIWLKINVRAT